MFKDLSRRHFLAGSTAAAGAVTLGGTLGAGTALAADPLKVGYIYVGPLGDFGWTHGHDVARRTVEAHTGDKIGRASCRERGVSTCRSRWLPDTLNKNEQNIPKG